MKKLLIMIMAVFLAAALVSCGGVNGPSEEVSQSPAASESTPVPQSTEQSPAAAVSGGSESIDDIVYEFELTDLDGNVHKLSDYRGKPVYLRVWASWCSVCLSSLENLDKLAGEAEDFAVLSVVMPGYSGEMSAEDFSKWYKDFGYENLTVLLDPEAKIVSDFGINAFPSQIMFDAEGHIAYGVIGLMESELIEQTMEKIAAGEQ